MRDLQAELRTRTWRWFEVRLSGLTSESSWSYAIWPADPKTGERSRAEAVQIVEDPNDVDAYFARQAG